MVAAIRDAENRTSGEIRVHLESTCAGNARKRAEYLFHHLKMDNTKDANGILFYLAVDDHKFTILGDSGIDRNVGEGFWEEIRSGMESRFRESEYTKGLVYGIQETGVKLSEFFPWQEDDINELPDEITTG